VTFVNNGLCLRVVMACVVELIRIVVVVIVIAVLSLDMLLSLLNCAVGEVVHQRI